MKISIITVTYNSAQTITRAIRSVCRQDYPDLEYIIIDGESADNTLHIIKDYAKQYPNIHYISESDHGIYDAINKGIKMATGDVIGLINSDDEIANNHVVSDIAKRMTETGADILYGDLVYCSYDIIEHNNPHIVRYWKSNDFKKSDLRKGWMPAHPTLYCRKHVFEQIGCYRTDFRISADYEFMLRALECDNYTTTYLPQVMVIMSTGGISNRNLSSILLKMKEDARAMRLHHLPVLSTIFRKNFSKIGQFFHH